VSCLPSPDAARYAGRWTSARHAPAPRIGISFRTGMASGNANPGERATPRCTLFTSVLIARCDPPVGGDRAVGAG
jgi:hypothetical protein